MRNDRIFLYMTQVPILFKECTSHTHGLFRINIYEYLEEDLNLIKKNFQRSTYPDNIVYMSTPNDQISTAASYPCLFKT